MTSILSLRTLALGAALLSLAALAAAYTAEHVFGLMPCELCLLQRKPFMIAAGLGLATALFPARQWRRAAVALLGLVFLANAGIAFYHMGVERKWWAASCAPADGAALDLSDLAAAMSRPVEVRCDTPAWEWNGITMAGMNVVFSGALALVALGFAIRRENRP